MGVARFELEVVKEYDRAKKLKCVWGKQGGGYEDRYGVLARERYIEQVSKKLMCITTIMDHVDSESKKLYEGTPCI